jgi:hypothetical protein
LQNPEALDSFGRAPKNVTDAYIVWALTSSNLTEMNLTLEISNLTQLADDSITNQDIDTYFISLVSAILYNVQNIAGARKYADVVA